MLKKLSILGLFAGQALGNPSPAKDCLEICVPSGACAIPVFAKEIVGTVYLVQSEQDLETLRTYWSQARFYLTTAKDYNDVLDTMVYETIVMPAVNPNDGLMEKGGKPALISGSIQTGPITIGGGGGQCSDCHGGSWKEIHSGVLRPSKPQDPK